MMYHQQPPPKHDDNADEASSLLTVITASPASLSTKKKNDGVPLRLMIATVCVLLGTLVVLYSGGRGSSNRHNNTHLPGGTSAALLLGHNPAATVDRPYYDPYDPKQDFCFQDNFGKSCWYPTDNHPSDGNWIGQGGRDSNDCGPKCIY